MMDAPRGATRRRSEPVGRAPGGFTHAGANREGRPLWVDPAPETKLGAHTVGLPHRFERTGLPPMGRHLAHVGHPIHSPIHWSHPTGSSLEGGAEWVEPARGTLGGLPFTVRPWGRCPCTSAQSLRSSKFEMPRHDDGDDQLPTVGSGPFNVHLSDSAVGGH